MLACWDCWCEFSRGHGCLSVVSVVCCQVEVSESGWSLVQRSPSQGDVSKQSVILKWRQIEGSQSLGRIEPWKKILSTFRRSFLPSKSKTKQLTTPNNTWCFTTQFHSSIRTVQFDSRNENTLLMGPYCEQDEIGHTATFWILRIHFKFLSNTFFNLGFKASILYGLLSKLLSVTRLLHSTIFGLTF